MGKDCIELTRDRTSFDDFPDDQLTFDRITRLASAVMQTRMAAISLHQNDQQPLMTAGQGVEELGPDFALPFLHYAEASDAPMVVNDALADPRFSHDPLVTGGPRLRFYLGVPLRAQDGATLGMLSAIDTQPHTPSAEQIAMVAELARMVVNRMELRQLALTDALTGALTRRGFEERVEAERKRCLRSGFTMNLIAIDIDRFKSINDRFGHAAGDATLRAVVDICRENLRTCDVIGRIGGEEFLVMLPEMSARLAARVAERLRAAIADLKLPVGGESANITVSVGVALFSPTVQTTQQALLRADIALYAAKARGRNRVVLDPSMH
jgi:diguanylate cyclase (GGDEF)-like protein